MDRVIISIDHGVDMDNAVATPKKDLFSFVFEKRDDLRSPLTRFKF